VVAVVVQHRVAVVVREVYCSYQIRVSALDLITLLLAQVGLEVNRMLYRV
jgi:hypothetical protein